MAISVIPDFGMSTTKIAEDIDFTPTGDEAHVVRFKDDLSIADLTTAQIDFADLATPGGRWELARFSMTVTLGQGS